MLIEDELHSNSDRTINLLAWYRIMKASRVLKLPCDLVLVPLWEIKPGILQLSLINEHICNGILSHDDVLLIADTVDKDPVISPCAVIGTCVFPGLGTAAGGIIGGFIGTIVFTGATLASNRIYEFFVCYYKYTGTKLITNLERDCIHCVQCKNKNYI